MQVEIMAIKWKLDESTTETKKHERVRAERVRRMKKKDNTFYPTQTKTESGYMSKNKKKTSFVKRTPMHHQRTGQNIK